MIFYATTRYIPTLMITTQLGDGFILSGKILVFTHVSKRGMPIYRGL